MVSERLQGRHASPKLALAASDGAVVTDPITREFRLRRIRWVAKYYKLRWLIDQHSFGIKKLEDLDDCKLLDLHRDMEKARECMDEGVSVVDAGLIRHMGEM